jgi:hypothetical protein
MTPKTEPSAAQLEIIKQLLALRAAERAANAANPTTANPTPQSDQNQNPKKEQTGGKQCHVHAHRAAITGQFYALSNEDRVAFDHHCAGIAADLKPVNNRENWLATSIAEDQWRLSRARALENNIFAIGMSAGPIADATNGDSPEVLAAACQARVWLTDGKHIQALALYEHRIRRTIEKNEKQLKEIQAERNAPREQAFEEAILLAELALREGATYDPAEDLGENGFGFSSAEIMRLAGRRIRLQRALDYHKRKPTPFPATPFPTTKAA